MKWNALELTRQAGNIIRSHTNAQHGQKTVAEHTYNLVNIILLLHPAPSMNLVKAAMWHDVPERFTGDLPSPIKQLNPDLGETLHKIEHGIVKSFGLEVPLNADEKKWLKAADRLEYLLWAQEQIEMGNSTVEHAINYAHKWLVENAPNEISNYVSTPKPVVSFTDIAHNEKGEIAR